MHVYLLVIAIALGVFANVLANDAALSSYLASVHCGSEQVNLSGKLMRMCRRCLEKEGDPNIGCTRMSEKTKRKCKRFHLNFCASPTTTAALTTTTAPILTAGTWIQGHKCPLGTFKTAFQGNLKYDLIRAKDECAGACGREAKCQFSNLFYTSEKQVCYRVGSTCGDWKNNKHGLYHLYKKTVTPTRSETTFVKTTDRAVNNKTAITSYVGNYCDDEGYSGVRLKLCKTCYRMIIRDGCATLADEFLLGCRKADASFCPFQKPTLPTTKVGRIKRRYRKDGVLEPLRTAVIVISVAVVLLSVAVITVAVVCRRRRRFTDRETLI